MKITAIDSATTCPRRLTVADSGTPATVSLGIAPTGGAALVGLTPLSIEVPRADLLAALVPDGGETAPRDPEARVDAFIATLDGFDLIAVSAGALLYAADVRDVLGELVAWRALAADRLAVIDRLAEQLAEIIDPAPQEQTGGNA